MICYHFVAPAPHSVGRIVHNVHIRWCEQHARDFVKLVALGWDTVTLTLRMANEVNVLLALQLNWSMAENRGKSFDADTAPTALDIDNPWWIYLRIISPSSTECPTALSCMVVAVVIPRFQVPEIYKQTKNQIKCIKQFAKRSLKHNWIFSLMFSLGGYCVRACNQLFDGQINSQTIFTFIKIQWVTNIFFSRLINDHRLKFVMCIIFE